MDKYRESSKCVIAAPYVCDFDGTTAQILELPGTSHTLPAADKVKQAEALGNRVCVARNIAARLGGCQFLPEPRVTALGQPHLAGSVVPNCDTILDSVSMGVDDTEVVSNSAGGKLGDGADNDFIFERALVFIQPQYGR